MSEKHEKDDVFEKFLQNALEEGKGLDAKRMEAIERFARREAEIRKRRRLAWRWGASLLTAASVSIVALFCGKADGRAVGGMASVTGAIELLCDLDGIDDGGLGPAEADEMLLAWQEAPCADLL